MASILIKNFDRWAIVVAMMTTLFSVILILVGTLMDYAECSDVVSHPKPRFSGVIASMGTYMFAFGGHVVFPSVQHDMKDPRQFNKSAIVAFFGEFHCFYG